MMMRTNFREKWLKKIEILYKELPYVTEIDSSYTVLFNRPCHLLKQIQN